MLHILPDIKIYYKGQQVLPSKNVNITVSNYKDGWLEYAIHRLLKDSYPSESIEY